MFIFTRVADPMVFTVEIPHYLQPFCCVIQFSRYSLYVSRFHYGGVLIIAMPPTCLMVFILVQAFCNFQRVCPSRVSYQRIQKDCEPYLITLIPVRQHPMTNRIFKNCDFAQHYAVESTKLLCILVAFYSNMQLKTMIYILY